MLRNGLSYSQASKNANEIGASAYNKAMELGKSIGECEQTFREAYEKEMNWYERK